MKALTPHFENELNLWMDKLVETVTSEGVPAGWVSKTLESLNEKKTALLQSFTDSALDYDKIYRELSRQANTLLSHFDRDSGLPSWLSQPLAMTEEYLSGGERPPLLAESFKLAFQEIFDQGQSPQLEASLRQLMLWAEGHLELTVWQLQAEMKKVRDNWSTRESSVDETLSLEQLLDRFLFADDDEKEVWQDAFLEEFDLWFEDLHSLQQDLEDLNHVPESFATFMVSLESFENAIGTYLDGENESANLSGELQGLADTWETVSSDVRAVLSMAETGVQNEDYEYDHLLSLRAAAESFQTGHSDLGALQSEISAHVARWNQVEALLQSDSSVVQGSLTTIRASLEALTTVTSPTDCRLSPLVSVYCETLRSVA